VEFGGYVSAAAAFACALKDLALAVGEWVGFGVPGFGGEGGVDYAKAAMDTADGFGEFFRGTVFEEVASGACVHGPAEIA